MATMRIALLGAGDICPLHVKGVLQTDDATIVGIWNRTREKAAQRAAEFGIGQVYESPEGVFADSNVDAVYVLTNMETHVDYSIAALKAGKHVLVEKPVAANVGDIQRLREVMLASGKCCMPVHNYIYEPSVMRTRSLLDSGQLGRICSIYVMYNIHHPEAVCARYPGVIRQILTHHAYISLYLANERPTMVSCLKATINDGSVPQENLVHATLQFPSGALAHLGASFASDDHSADPWTCLIKVIGTEGATRFSYRDWVENRPGAVHSHTYSCYPLSISNVSQHFIERVIRRGEAPLSTLEDAAVSQQIVEACERSASEARHVPLECSRAGA